MFVPLCLIDITVVEVIIIPLCSIRILRGQMAKEEREE